MFKPHLYRGRIVYKPPHAPQEYDDPHEKRLELTRTQLEQMFPRMRDIPISIEHHGARCGRVLRPYFDDDGSACIEFELDVDSTLGKQAFLYMCSGMIGLSLSHDATTLDPVEISLCLEGARANTGVLQVIPSSSMETESTESPEPSDTRTSNSAYIESNDAPESLLVRASASSVAPSTTPATFVCRSFLSDPVTPPSTPEKPLPAPAPAPASTITTPPATTIEASTSANNDTTMEPIQNNSNSNNNNTGNTGNGAGAPTRSRQFQNILSMIQDSTAAQNNNNNMSMQVDPSTQQLPPTNKQQGRQSTQPTDAQNQMQTNNNNNNNNDAVADDQPDTITEDEKDALERLLHNPRVSIDVKRKIIDQMKEFTSEQQRLATQNEMLRQRNERLEKEMSDSHAMMQATLSAMLQRTGVVDNAPGASNISHQMLDQLDSTNRRVLVQASEAMMKAFDERDRMRSDTVNQELVNEARRIRELRRSTQHLVNGSAGTASTWDATTDSTMSTPRSSVSSSAASSAHNALRAAVLPPRAADAFAREDLLSQSSHFANQWSAPQQYPVPQYQYHAPVPAARDAFQWNQNPGTSATGMHAPDASQPVLINASAAGSHAAPQRPKLTPAQRNEQLLTAALQRMDATPVPDGFDRSLYKNTPWINRNA